MEQFDEETHWRIQRQVLGKMDVEDTTKWRRSHVTDCLDSKVEYKQEYMSADIMSVKASFGRKHGSDIRMKLLRMAEGIEERDKSDHLKMAQEVAGGIVQQ